MWTGLVCLVINPLPLRPHTHTHTHSVAQERYRASRTILYRNSSTLPLNQTGPQVNLQVSVRNTRDSTNGTAFPRTTLLIHLPIEFRDTPLLIPTSVVVTSGEAVCSHSNAVPSGLVSECVCVCVCVWEKLSISSNWSVVSVCETA